MKQLKIFFVLSLFLLAGCNGEVSDDQEVSLVLSDVLDDMFQNPPLGRFIIGTDGNIVTPANAPDEATRDYLNKYGIAEIVSIDLGIFDDENEVQQYKDFASGLSPVRPEIEIVNGWLLRFDDNELIAEYPGEYFLGTEKARLAVLVGDFPVMKYLYKLDQYPDAFITAYVFNTDSFIFQFDGVLPEQEPDILELIPVIIEAGY